jgi:hypothetical protein
VNWGCELENTNFLYHSMKARMARQWKRNGALATDDCGDFLVASEPAHETSNRAISHLEQKLGCALWSSAECSSCVPL